MLNSKTLEQRQRGIGGSDAAKVLGVSRWGGPFSVWNSKVNGTESELDNEAIHWGNVLEDAVAREFAAREGVQLRTREDTVFSAEYPFMLANVDRELVGINAGLECKTASAFKADEWSGDNLPDEYYVQVQHYNAVMGWAGCWIACLIGGQKFIYKFVPRNNAFIKDLIQIEKDFWENYVLTKTPPALSITDNIVIAQSSDELIAANDEDMQNAAQLAKIKAEIKSLEVHKDVLETYFKNRIGDKAGINGVATYKKIKDSIKVDWDALCEGENISKETIAKYSHTQEGSRRFLLKYKEVTINGNSERTF